ncbi:SIMPL domain-containing protein [Candidatus Gottesmanbacteria bacterium]|nr:SIMPL domain-containing protein [Candidatus Gottesmanbacteria bacterium]
MNKIGGALVLFFLLLFAYTKLAGPIPFAVTSVTTQKTDMFQVSGEGKVSVLPDIAIVNAGVTVNGPSVKAAQDQLNAKINAVSQAVKAVGVMPADIQTSNYSVFPMYNYQQGSQITGYNASSNLTIKVRQMDKANVTIDAATSAGANQIGGISFDVDDKTKAENQAREQAVAQAKRKAQDAAKIAGFTLGRIINYSESFGTEPRPIPLMAKTETSVPKAPTQVEPGVNEIDLTVTLSFEIR